MLKTIKPFVARLNPTQRLELIRWIVNEAPLPEEPLPTEAEDTWAARISAEAAAWHARPAADRAPYSGEYVAVLAGQVIDHDADQRTLAIRIRQQYPDTPVLLTEASARQPPEFVIRSPRLDYVEVGRD